MKRNCQKTQLYTKSIVLCSGYKEYLKSAAGRRSFDLVFIDPPYASDFALDALKRLIDGELLSEGAYVIVECDKDEPIECEGYETVKTYRYGKTFVTKLKKA